MDVQTYGVFVQDNDGRTSLVSTFNALIDARTYAESLRTANVNHAFVIPLAHYVPVGLEAYMLHQKGQDTV